MELSRSRFQGLTNVVKFNWHLYGFAFFTIIMILVCQKLLHFNFFIASFFIFSILLVNAISLIATYLVYDRSKLYELGWLQKYGDPQNIANISARFDETSIILKERFPNAKLEVMDFFDPVLHTELSIKRARRAYPAHPHTIKIKTDSYNYSDESFDHLHLFLSAHEIRDHQERASFFKSLKNSLDKEGYIFVTEHLRDIPNFLAYNIGFLHFLSRKKWELTFEKADLKIIEEVKTTSLITTFILQ